MADGSVTIDTKLNNDGLKSGLGKLGSIAKGALKGIAVTAGAVTTAFAGIVTASVKARGELEQQIGGTEAVFGEFAKQVQEQSKKAYSSMGLSANDYMATINKMSSLMQGSGISQEKSMNLASQAMQRASDVASIMGIDVTSAMEAINGAAKGNFTMMDNLGVAMNATTLEAYALEKGFNKTYTQMSNAEKVELAMQMFLEKSAYAAGNYAKENETLAGSINTLKASWNNFLSGAGGLEQVIESGEMAIESIVKTVDEALPSIINSLVNALPRLIELGGQILQKLLDGILSNLPQIIATTLTLIQTLLTALIQYAPLILQGAVEIIKQLASGLAQMLPTLIPQAVECIITLVMGLLDNIDLLIDAGIELIFALADGLIEALPILIEKAPEIIQKLFDALVRNFPKIVKAGGELIGKLVAGLIGSLYKLMEVAPQLIANLVNGLKRGHEEVKNMGKYLIEGLWNGISGMASWVADKVRSFGKNILNNMKEALGIHSPSTLFRDQVGKNIALGVGEGFEDNISKVYRQMKSAVDFETQKLSTNLSATAMMSKVITANINVNGNVDMDGTKVGRLVAPAVSRTLRTAGA